MHNSAFHIICYFFTLNDSLVIRICEKFYFASTIVITIASTLYMLKLKRKHVAMTMICRFYILLRNLFVSHDFDIFHFLIRFWISFGFLTTWKILVDPLPLISQIRQKICSNMLPNFMKTLSKSFNSLWGRSLVVYHYRSLDLKYICPYLSVLAYIININAKK